MRRRSPANRTNGVSFPFDHLYCPWNVSAYPSGIPLVSLWSPSPRCLLHARTCVCVLALTLPALASVSATQPNPNQTKAPLPFAQ